MLHVFWQHARLTDDALPAGVRAGSEPDELAWSHAKRSASKRGPIKTGEKMQAQVDEELTKIKENPALVRQFFKHPTVAYSFDL